MSMDFNISSELKNRNLILKTSGYINNYGGEKIVEEFSKYQITEVDKVIFDLEHSKVVNSIGISFLIEVIETINQNECKLFFANLDPTIEKTFFVMGLFQFAEKAESINAVID
jgi:anti-anti-sigma factor